MSSDPASPTVEDHLDYLRVNVQVYLRPLLIDILRHRPQNVLAFITEWCQTKGPQVTASNQSILTPLTSSHNLEPQNNLTTAVDKHLADSSTQLPTQCYLPSSDEEDDFLTEEDAAREAEMLEKRKSKAKKKHAVSAEAYGSFNKLENYVPKLIPKSIEQTDSIREVLKKNFMFNALDEKEQMIIIDAMDIKSFPANTMVIKQGDNGQELFIVAEGRLRCTKVMAENEEAVFLRYYEAGELFGELALMYNAPRAASIDTLTHSVLYCLDRDTFNHIVKTSVIKKRASYENFLNNIEILKDLEAHERVKLCDCLQTEKFKRGDIIIRQGEEGDRIYFIQEGTAEVLKRTEQGDIDHVYDYQANDYFGELALLNNDKRQATVRVTSDTMTVASLDKQSFKRLLGSVESILKRNVTRYEKYVKKKVL